MWILFPILSQVCLIHHKMITFRRHPVHPSILSYKTKSPSPILQPRETHSNLNLEQYTYDLLLRRILLKYKFI